MSAIVSVIYTVKRCSRVISIHIDYIEKRILKKKKKERKKAVLRHIYETKILKQEKSFSVRLKFCLEHTHTLRCVLFNFIGGKITAE